ncbi:hypothetical protein FRC12_024536 [Ceratobasidium sp. 428]|nr:hypothetical protein FRC12_024536 [Ceratobasidium sp. 428]
MSITSNSSSSSSQLGDVKGIRGVKSVRIDVSPNANLVPKLELPSEASTPPGLPIPLHLSPKLDTKCPPAPHSNFKPKGPRSQPHKNTIKTPELHPLANINEHDEYNIPTTLPPRKTVGLYGDEPRLPSHRPSRYIPEYAACNGDRFAHLAPFQKNKTLIIDRHASVDIATMGLERFTMKIEGPERRKAGVFQLLGVKAKQPPLHNAAQLGLVRTGLRVALTNFRARFGVRVARVARGKESSIEAPVGGSYGHSAVDETFSGWIAP